MVTDKGRKKGISENMFDDHAAVADVPSRRSLNSVVGFGRLLTLLGRRDRVLVGREALFAAFAHLPRAQFPHLTGFMQLPTEIITVDKGLKDCYQEWTSGKISGFRMLIDAEKPWRLSRDQVIRTSKLHRGFGFDLGG
jgi:hypothetical protein